MQGKKILKKRKMECRAKYIGIHGQYGYLQGFVYPVQIFMRAEYIFVQTRGLPAKGYSSIGKMLKEWEFIEDGNYYYNSRKKC